MEKQAKKILKFTMDSLSMNKEDAEYFLFCKTTYPFVTEFNELEIMNIVNKQRKEIEAELNQGVLF